MDIMEKHSITVVLPRSSASDGKGRKKAEENGAKNGASYLQKSLISHQCDCAKWFVQEQFLFIYTLYRGIFY